MGVLRSYVGVANPCAVFRVSPSCEIVGADCGCVAGAAIHLCRHVLGLLFGYIQHMEAPCSSTDQERAWGFPTHSPSGRGGLARDHVASTFHARIPDITKRSYDRTRRLDAMEARLALELQHMQQFADDGRLRELRLLYHQLERGVEQQQDHTPPPPTPPPTTPQPTTPPPTTPPPTTPPSPPKRQQQH